MRYCGNGNFTLPVARNFRRVLANEIDEPAVRGAEICAKKAESWLIQQDSGSNQGAELLAADLRHVAVIGPQNEALDKGAIVTRCYQVPVRTVPFNSLRST